MTRIVYLHGFASGPHSNKADFFRARFERRGVDFETPELDEGNFEGLTVTSQLKVVDRAVKGQTVILMGSSLGGYLAALYAARHRNNVGRLVLLAPAFQFPSRWRARFSDAELAEWKRTGSRTFFHYSYNGDRPLGYQMVEDAPRYEDEPDFVQPALVLHGVNDTVVPPEASQHFAEGHPNVILRLVPSDHALTDVLDLLWEETSAFLGFQKP
jgi:pimeloyl-ACP methyl ester carboxylesterase